MRLSSPSVAAAFIDGARAQGADVVDYGMMGTDMMYFAVARDGHDGGAQITASHNPKEYNGIKMVRREAFPLSGEAGISDIRDMIATGTLPPRSAGAGSLSTMAVIDDYVRARDVVHRSVDHQAVQRRARRRQRHRRHGRAEAVRAAALHRADDAVLRGRRDVPEPRSQSAHRREPPRHRRARHAGEGGHRHRLGRRRRPLLLHRRHRRVHRRRLRHGAARRGVPAQASGREDRLRRPRQLRGQGHRRASTAARR